MSPILTDGSLSVVPCTHHAIGPDRHSMFFACIQTALEHLSYFPILPVCAVHVLVVAKRGSAVLLGVRYTCDIVQHVGSKTSQWLPSG